MSEFETIELRFEPPIIWLTLKVTSFSTPLLRDLERALDIIETREGPQCLICTSSHPKVFSGGLEFQTLMDNHHDVNIFISEFARVNARVLSLSIPTIAMINGHCIAGGLMFAMAFDFRYMLKGPFKLVMNEIVYGMGIPRFMLAPLMAKLGSKILRDMTLFAETIALDKSVEVGIIDELFPSIEALREACVNKANSVATFAEKRLAFKTLKRTLYKNFVEMADVAVEPLTYQSLRELTPKL